MKTKMTDRGDAISARERVHQVEADCSRNEDDQHVRQGDERKIRFWPAFKNAATCYHDSPRLKVKERPTSSARRRAPATYIPVAPPYN
jgi:hypothetical protein